MMLKTINQFANSALGIVPAAIRSDFLNYISLKRPSLLTVEVTNICNADCTFCTYRYLEQGKGIMTFETFKKAVDDYAAMGGGPLSLTPTVGEPLLDSDFVSKLSYAGQAKKIQWIRFHTNLLALHRHDIRGLLTSGVSNIRISACIKDEATYERVYRAKGYRQLIQNIIDLCEMNRRLKEPVLITLHIRAPKPYEEVLQSRDYQTVSKYFKPENIILSQYETEYHSWNGQINEEELPSGHHFQNLSIGQYQEPCKELYRNLSVLWDGRIKFCKCRDMNADMVVGDLKRQNLAEVWLGQELKEYRENWQKGILPKFCRGCDEYVPRNSHQEEDRLPLLKNYIRSELS